MVFFVHIKQKPYCRISTKSQKKTITYKKVLLQQQEREIDDAVQKAQAEYIERCANENQIPLDELEDKLQPIVDSCTKDSIQNGNYDCILSSFSLAMMLSLPHTFIKKTHSERAKNHT